MKYEIINILFNWITTPIIHLSVMQLVIASAELLVVFYTLLGISKFFGKIKGD